MTNPPRSIGIAEHVAANVRAELGRHNKRLGDLAEHLDVSSQTASSRLAGRSEFGIVELVSIAQWLGIDISILTAGTEQTAVGA